MDILQEYGYVYDADELKRAYKETMGRAPTKGTRNFFEGAAPHIVMAYKLGTEGKELARLFPYIKKSAPAATETPEPKPSNQHDNSTTTDAIAQGGGSEA